MWQIVVCSGQGGGRGGGGGGGACRALGPSPAPKPSSVTPSTRLGFTISSLALNPKPQTLNHRIEGRERRVLGCGGVPAICLQLWVLDPLPARDVHHLLWSKGFGDRV